MTAGAVDQSRADLANAWFVSFLILKQHFTYLQINLIVKLYVIIVICKKDEVKLDHSLGDPKVLRIG